MRPANALGRAGIKGDPFEGAAGGGSKPGLWPNVLAWQSLPFAAYLAAALLYWRRTDDLPLWKAVCWSPAVAVSLYLSFAAGWRALWQIVTRRGHWTKTERAVEEPVTGGTPVPEKRTVEDARSTEYG
ncbi:hypothetical protein [Streptomyces mobaraensis]|uniref:hypothetical protein n=1 Tax=Streptomyces mobaraensis TaxID=35621 RepID=UPI003402EFD3